MKGPNRWPPILGLGLTAVLVFLVLPNPLNVPQNNPAAQAEYAPVPGDQDDSANANFGEAGAATSEGIGEGGFADGGLPPPPPPLKPVFVPRNKRCTGTPPRQTEDPLSPPCVPFFEGSNGGATYQGVTENEILVIFYNDLGVEGDMNAAWRISDESAGHEASANNQQTYLVLTVKRLFKYFSNRYQTYGRQVRLFAVASQAGITSTCGARKIEAAVIADKYKPFATVHFGDGGQCYLNEMAQFNPPIPGFGLNADVPRAEFEAAPGLVWGFFPDQETEAAWSASFICRKLWKDGEGRRLKARFAGNSQTLSGEPLREQPRKFGLIYPKKSDRGPESAQLASLLQQYLERECGIVPDQEGTDGLIIKAYSNDGGTEAPSIIQDLYRKDVTTIICYCVPVQTELTVQKMQTTASQLNYYPEWYWDHTSRMFRAVWNQRHGSPQHFSFGTTYHWRNPAFEEQMWYLAFKSVEPGRQPNTRFGFDIYHLFLNLFQGIQGAGPELTPQSVQRGMFTFKYLNTSDYFRPIGGYGSDHEKAVSSYTFIDTAHAFWWDPTGKAPGDAQSNGCLRAIREGRRFRAGEWPEGDADIRLGDNGGGDPSMRSPCYQDDTKILDSGTFGF